MEHNPSGETNTPASTYEITIFMEPQGTLPWSQYPSIGAYPDEYSQHPHICSESIYA